MYYRKRNTAGYLEVSMASASRAIYRLGLALCAGGFLLGLGGLASAQSDNSVSLVLQDFSDCTNGNVKDNGGAAPGGTIWLVRNRDGSVNIKVGISATPLTAYNFYLKCVRQLGTIKTDEDGTGEAIYTLPPGTVGQVFAFDMYPDGAPAGNKFQSVQARLP
jgi:hypothetical protein